jgi:hypothetical protein
MSVPPKHPPDSQGSTTPLAPDTATVLPSGDAAPDPLPVLPATPGEDDVTECASAPCYLAEFPPDRP